MNRDKLRLSLFLGGAVVCALLAIAPHDGAEVLNINRRYEANAAGLGAGVWLHMLLTWLEKDDGA